MIIPVLILSAIFAAVAMLVTEENVDSSLSGYNSPNFWRYLYFFNLYVLS